VRPDVVVYHAPFTADLPIGLTVQSLMNALAHPIGALAGGGERAAALECAAALVRAMEDLLLAPGDLGARERASRGASSAGLIIEGGKPGVHHALAHLLGGGLGLPHAGLHSVLLPQSLAHLRAQQPALVDELERAVMRRDLEAHLHDLLTRALAPTSLEGLGADPAALRALLATRPELPAEVALDALVGLRPSGRAGRLALGSAPPALLAGPPPARARRVVLALHGRGAEAGGMVRRISEITGRDPEIAVVGLRSAGGTRWYGTRYGNPGAATDPEVVRALGEVDAAIQTLTGPEHQVDRGALILAGFSQGACLALTHAAQHGRGLAAVIAPCGARIAPPAEWAPATATLAGLPVLLGAGDADPWIDAAHLSATAAWFRAAGAAVEVVGSSGDRHDIMARQRLRARALISGRPAPAGPTGFGNTLASEALPGALPPRQNTPRRAPHGLYAEQLSGTGFTAARADNQRTWLYRVRPSPQRRAFVPLAHPHMCSDFTARTPEINLAGWAPRRAPGAPADFIDGLATLGGAGSPALRRGYAVHTYACNRDMERRAFTSADGDLVVIPELGALTLLTELGPLEVAPGRIAVIPRGIVFSVHLHGGFARGTLAESFGRHFRLPERGVVGANGLADARHFRAPAAWHEDRLTPDFRVVAKLGGALHQASQDHSPFDVVAWHGTYFPSVYDLDDFSPVAGVRFDHADPSVYTVLSAPLDEPGAHTLDLIVFAPRWDVTEGTFRPPFFHRNVVSELNGIVRESAPPGTPWQPGTHFLTPSLTAHGVSGRTVERVRALADADADRPQRLGGPASLWFQLESALPMCLTPWAEAHRLPDWPATWGSHASFFDPEA